MEWTRSSGILLHPTSLPGPYGIGDLGPPAYRWVEFLARAGQTLWQVLPLGPTGYADSPYAALSTFALNPMLISLDLLFDQRLLDPPDIDTLPWLSRDRVDYATTIAYKAPILRRAALRFDAEAVGRTRAAYDQFCRDNASWLDDYALYIAAKRYHADIAWPAWERGIALRDPQALDRWREKLRIEIIAHRALQYLAWAQWRALLDHAHQYGVRIVGDVPIFCAHDSADVWAHRDLFALDEEGQPTHIAGVPPDYFSATGQRWGNPLYRWDVMAERGYAWWIERTRAALRTVDIVRIDHFRGFIAYWEIPASEPTAVRGRWVPGPGEALFEALEAALGSVPILAEDLGVITPEVIALRERFNLPGMKILQFAFDEDALRASFGEYERNPFLPHNYTRHFVVYTGTHDNDTAVGWFTHADPEERAAALAYLGCNAHDLHWALIRAAMASVADMAIVPLQDVLGLGSHARMNLPGTIGANWTWRFTEDMLSEHLAARLAEMATLYERW
ncbi:MAG: 4-alpha-glucanotransferase [Anaerolineae bacterium]|nr:4-alpha-glucanotransferase [Anaerolineae bacterium]